MRLSVQNAIVPRFATVTVAPGAEPSGGLLGAPRPARKRRGISRSLGARHQAARRRDSSTGRAVPAVPARMHLQLRKDLSSHNPRAWPPGPSRAGRQTTMSEELPREEGLISEESERWISNLFSALTPQHRKYLLFPWNEVPKVPEETPATEAEADVPRDAAEEPDSRRVQKSAVLCLMSCPLLLHRRGVCCACMGGMLKSKKSVELV